MPLSEARKRANENYLDKQDDIKVRVPKGHREELKQFAKSHNEKLNEFINKAVDERIERIGRSESLFAPPIGEWCEGCKRLGEMKPAAQAGHPPEDWRPICGLYVCELDAPGGNAQKCAECAKGGN